jgi:hypothetical protein
MPVQATNEHWFGNTLPPPVDLDDFAEYAEERGWTVWREWLDEWTDEDGEIIPAHWFYFVQREKWVGETIHTWNISIDAERITRDLWEFEVDFAETGWKHYCRGQGIEP